MKHITFLGASGTVTGSSYFLHEDDGKGILIDMGMFQGSHELERWNYDSVPLHPEDIDAVFLTHAHLDHSGRLPLLRKLGFQGPIFMTEATKMLVELTLRDTAHIAKEHMNGHELYTESDVEWVLGKIHVINYHEPISIGNFAVTYRDAGHILGSAILEVFSKQNNDGVKRIIFSGDLGNYPEELVKPTEFITQGDIVLMESTYGDREHSNERAKDVLQEEINAVEENGGTLLIPAFSIERTQELLHTIDHLKKSEIIRNDTPVYLDSPLGIHVTHVYQQYRSLYNNELKEHAYTDDPFNFPGLTMVGNYRESNDIIHRQGTKVIIAGSGMMNGGRILNHAAESLPNPNTRILFVGFQAEGTLGRAIIEGNKEVIINNRQIPVHAHVRKSSCMSSHADQSKLIEWYSKIQGVDKLFLVHGENRQRGVLAEIIRERMPHMNSIYLPTKNQTFSLHSEKSSYVYFGASSKKNIKKERTMPRMAVLGA
jgi:metallo-beta-lactamase family protein